MDRRAWCLKACGLLLGTHCLPATATTADGWSEVTLPAAQQFDLHSSEGLAYRIYLSAPAAPPPPDGYPVFYVLDGNAAFPVAAFLARILAGRRDVSGHPPALVVGIGYPGATDFDVPARRRDYTPGTSQPGAEAGRADAFLDFIEGRVKPLVASRRPVDARRQALFGHSFGGLFVLHVLLTRPAAFSTYVASSPSIWWDGQRVLEGMPRLLAAETSPSPRVQISVGALEDDPPKGTLPPETRALLATRRMIPPARDLAARLRALPGWEGRVTYHELAGEDHGPVWLPAMTRGLQFFLDSP